MLISCQQWTCFSRTRSSIHMSWKYLFVFYISRYQSTIPQGIPGKINLNNLILEKNMLFNYSCYRKVNCNAAQSEGEIRNVALVVIKFHCFVVGFLQFLDNFILSLSNLVSTDFSVFDQDWFPVLHRFISAWFDVFVNSFNIDCIIFDQFLIDEILFDCSLCCLGNNVFKYGLIQVKN